MWSLSLKKWLYFRTHSSQLCELHGFLNLSEYTKKLNGCGFYLPSTAWPFDWDVCGHFLIWAIPSDKIDCFHRAISDIRTVSPNLKFGTYSQIYSIPFLCIFRKTRLDIEEGIKMSLINLKHAHVDAQALKIPVNDDWNDYFGLYWQSNQL